MKNYFVDDTVRPMKSNFGSSFGSGSDAKAAAEAEHGTPDAVEQFVLSVSSHSSLDLLCSALDSSDWLLARARSIDRLAKQIAIGWIERNGEFDVGTLHFSVGYSSVVRCLDIPNTANAVLHAADGDFCRLVGVLVAQPFKSSAVRTLIGRPLHDKLFETRRAAAFKGGSSGRELRRTDRRFLK